MLQIPPPVLLIEGTSSHVFFLLLSFALLLVGAEIFTNGVEWVGHRFGFTQGATGSVLAAVGTALPETMIPVIAIARGLLSGNDAGNDVAVGAILGAPFMLSTIAMFLVGAAVISFGGRRSEGATLDFDTTTIRRDLSVFLVAYSLAVVAAFVTGTVRTLIAISLILVYIFYVRRTLTGGAAIDPEGLERLHAAAFMQSLPVELPNPKGEREPSTTLILLQPLFALVLIIVAAHLFVDQIVWFAEEVIAMPVAVISLLVAPLVTELPEKFNSIIWISEDKDTLALGNITGAMVFQGTLPVTLGILFTSWDLSLTWGTVGFLNVFSAFLALVGGGILYLRVRPNDALSPYPFLVGGLFYALFIAVVVYHVLNYDLNVVALH